MKSSSHPEPFVRFFVAALFAATVASCSEDREQLLPVSKATFSEESISVTENEGEKTISILLDRPSSTSGTIELKVTSSNATCFTTTPATENGRIVVDVHTGHRQITFKLMLTDNNKLDGGKSISFQIDKTPAHITVGSSSTIGVTVHDDESPAAANLPLVSAKLRENDTNGSVVRIELSTPAPAEGTVVVRLQTGAKYGTDFITEPTPLSSKIYLPVSAGQTFVSFRVVAVDDNFYRGERTIGVSLVDASGGVLVGSVTAFECTITEDDGQQLTDINSIRSKYIGEEDIILHGDLYIEAVVTSIDNVMPGRIVLQDASGALPIQLTKNINFTRGDRVIANLDYGRLHVVQGVLEVSQVSHIEKVDEGEVDTRVLSMEELYFNGDDFQSTTIQLAGLKFTQADGLTRMLGDRVATDGVRNVVVRTNTFASFRNELVPDGVVAITGILTKVGSMFILYPQEYSDIRHQMINPIIPNQPILDPGALKPRRSR